MFEKILAFIRDLYGQKKDNISLHEPVFVGNEKKYVLECIDSNFVSSVGKYVDQFEEQIRDYTAAKYAIATVNGTAALHIALLLSGVNPGDEVITQAISFVATANAIKYCNAEPVFLDSDKESLGLCPNALESFLTEQTELRDDGCLYNKSTNRKIAACVPMHVFGHPAKIESIKKLCKKNNIVMVEDAAEAVGSFFKGKHTGTWGQLGILSFNGNKIITTGGGGIILTDDEEQAALAKHLTTTAKLPHMWEYNHDQVGFNYRMPNINAALGCAQIEQLNNILESKRNLAQAYKEFFEKIGIPFLSEPNECRSNYWLNAIFFEHQKARDEFLRFSNSHNVMTRPLWKLLPDLQMFSHCQRDKLTNARWLQERLVNIPSSARL